MRQIIAPLAILFLLFVSASEQQENQISYPEYYRGINWVNYLLQYNQLENGIYLFDSISSRVPHIPTDNLMRIALNCAQNDSCELAAKYFKLALENGAEHGKEIGPFKIGNLCEEFINELLDLEDEIHAERFNYDYKMSVDSIFNLEQIVREKEDSYLVEEVDSLHMVQLLKLIDQYGFPGEKIVGYFTAWKAYFLMLFMDQDIGNKILKPILEQAYNDGYLSPGGLAKIVDRRRYYGPDKIEPYYYYFMSTEKFESFSPEQLSEVERRRDSIGLFKLEFDH